VRENLARYELWDESYQGRLVVLPGDLSRPRLGLSPADFAGLAGLIDVIYHNGALVNFVYPYQTHKNINVQGTAEILRLASTSRLKAVHFVSTLSVLHTGAHDSGRQYCEDADLVANGAPFGGYAQSKWVGEELIREAGRRGIPTAIYRPGPVGGHSITGVTNNEDLMSTLARACLLLGSAPELDTMVEIAPVDFCSAAIVELSLQQASFGKTFHLANPQRWAYRELVAWAREQGYPLQLLPYEEWRDRLLGLAQQFGGDEWGAFLPLLQETESGQIYMPAIDASNTLAGLAHTGVRCAPLGPELMGRYLSYFARVGLLPAPVM
jgi:thioester reductase-like protein